MGHHKFKHEIHDMVDIHHGTEAKSLMSKFCMTSMIENLSYCVKGYTISMKTSLDSSFSAVGGHGPH
jgi:hypothetical protein